MIEVLECEQIYNEDVLLKLDKKWKLPIAATFYWYQKVQQVPDKDLVKGLLVCFLACSNELWIENDERV